MQYTKDKSKTAVQDALKPTVVHTLGQMPATGNEQQKGKKTDSGPQGAEMFPATDEWKGKPVTGDYQTIPEDKDAIEENLRVAGEEVQSRFGLDQRGVDIKDPMTPDKKK